jgi:glycine cleavage system pyridoxal-binding protein P
VELELIQNPFLGWANIGAAVAPDAALASVASAIILVLGGQGVKGVFQQPHPSCERLEPQLSERSLLRTNLQPLKELRWQSLKEHL